MSWARLGAPVSSAACTRAVIGAIACAACSPIWAMAAR
jgi:hypothetical protein